MMYTQDLGRCSQDTEKRKYLLMELRYKCGQFHSTQLELHPIGGVKQSGLGRERFLKRSIDDMLKN